MPQVTRGIHTVRLQPNGFISSLLKSRKEIKNLKMANEQLEDDSIYHQSLVR